MTDAGTILPPDERALAGSHGRVLHRIASALGVPVSTFIGAGEGTAHRPPSTAENEALLDAFARIGDPAMRQRCLDMIRALADS